jgi:hypothetical protein
MMSFTYRVIVTCIWGVYNLKTCRAITKRKDITLIYNPSSKGLGAIFFIHAFLTALDLFLSDFHFRDMTPKKVGRHGGKKVGRKSSPVGKKTPVYARVNRTKLELHRWREKSRKLLSTLAAYQGKGTPYDEGKCYLALHVTLKLVDTADLRWDSESEKVCGLDPVFGEASELTGMSKSKIRRLFNSFLESEGATFFVGDNSTRGRAGENCNRSALQKLTTAHYDAIRAFIKHRNSSKGAGKVRCVGVGAGCVLVRGVWWCEVCVGARCVVSNIIQR